MREGYLVRSNKAVAFLQTVDRLLRICLPRKKRIAAPSNPKRILVSNWAHLGDVITSLPALRALRQQFPGAEIDLIVGKGSHIVLEGSGLYDRLYTIDHFVLNRSNEGRVAKWRTYLKGKKAFLAAAKSRRYDVAIDLYAYFPPASPLFWQAEIPVRCGFTSGGFGPALTHPVAWSYRNRHISQYGRDLIVTLWPKLDASIKHLASFYPIDHSFEPPMRSAPHHPYVVVHMGAGQSWREWPEASWAELVRLWGSKAPFLVFCGTGEREKARAHRVAQHSPTGRTSFFIDRPWKEFMSLLAGAAGVVCLESSASHAAAALSIPTVAIYSGANEHDLWGPHNPAATLVCSPTGCAPCHRAGCDSMACVKDVSPGDVLAAINAMMATTQRGVS